VEHSLNLADDPWEETDLAAANSAKLKELETMLTRFRVHAGLLPPSGE